LDAFLNTLLAQKGEGWEGGRIASPTNPTYNIGLLSPESLTQWDLDMSALLQKRRRAFLLLPILLGVLGCELTGGVVGNGVAGNRAATQSALALAVIQYSTSAGGRFPSPTVTPPGIRAHTPTVRLTPTSSETALPTLTPSTTLTATMVHTATPPETSGATRYILDPDTRDYAPQQKSPAGSDEYQFNRYERPYTAGTMEYLADVDLIRVELRVAPPWIYITLFVAGARPGGIGRTMYGAEIDVNRDGRGEYLIWGASPAGADWTTEGVEIWKDSNSDVGGSSPQRTNAPAPVGDGYELKIFAGGQGADPDLAWIRKLDGGNKIQLAFKYIVIKNTPAFLWNGWADFGVRRPDWFDYNDHFTQGEAGSPLPIQADYYPLQALFGVDNTCRDAYGFTPTGSEAGLCV
jgi:hypothetical protein